MRKILLAAACLIGVTSFAFNAQAAPGPKPPQDVNIVSPNPLPVTGTVTVEDGSGALTVDGTVGINGEVEVKNDTGGPLAVEVPPADDGYFIRLSNNVTPAEPSTDDNFTASSDSYLTGVLANITAGADISYCQILFGYPDASDAPTGSDTPWIFEMTRGTSGSQFIPLPDLFIAGGTEMTMFLFLGGGSTSTCGVVSTLYLRHAP